MKKEYNSINNLINSFNNQFFTVKFKKRTTGELRVMLCKKYVKRGLVGKEWANGKAGTPQDHNLLLVSDVNLLNTNNFRRSIPIENIVEIVHNETSYVFES
jgi:hypothetical protein